MDKEGENIWKNAEFANAINSLEENKLQSIRLIKINAELRYEKYNALIEEGFTEPQALHIITNTMIMD